MEDINDTIAVRSVSEEPEEEKLINETSLKVAIGATAGLAAGAVVDHIIENAVADDSDVAAQIASDREALTDALSSVEEDIQNENTSDTESQTQETVRPQNVAREHSSHNTEYAQPASTQIEEHITANHVAASNEHVPDVKVDNIRTVVDGNGNVQHIAAAHVDGHSAIFADDGQGHVQSAAVDINDNGQVDNNEVVDLRGLGMTMGDLANNMVQQDDVKVSSVTQQEQSHNVEVISVHHGTEIGDVAVVSVDGDNAMLVDINTDGDVDFLVHDDNNNNHLEQNEIHQVRPGIHMPTQDDVNGQNSDTSDDLPDYSNDSDIITYDI